MSHQEDKKLSEFKRELASLIGKHVVGLDESSISEVLEEYSETLQRASRPVRANGRRETMKLEEPSSALFLQSDTEASVAAAEDVLTGWSVFQDVRSRRAQPERDWALGSTSVADVLKEVSKLQSAGLFGVYRGRQGAEFVIRNGEIHDVRILPPSEKRSLLTLLQQSGRISLDDLTRLRRFAVTHGLSDARALLQVSNLLSREEVLSTVRARIRHLTLRILDSGPEIATYSRLDELSMSVSLTFVPIESIFNPGHIAPAVSTNSASKEPTPAAVPAPRAVSEPAPPAGIARRRERALSSIPEPESIPFTPDSFAYEEELPGLSETSSSWVDELKDATERIEIMEERLETKNHFEILGLHWATYDGEIDRRYKKLQQHFSVLSQPLGLEPKQRQRLRQIRARLKEVYAELSDFERRRNFRRAVASSTEQRKMARQFEHLADEAMQKKDFDVALDYYQRLLELEPNHVKAARQLPSLLMKAARS